jgi:protein-disulfide isomerase
VRRDFPLVSIHQNAFKAAEAANCAGEQEKYWEMHGRLFAHQNQLGMNQLPAHAKAIGIDMELFEQCFSGSQEAAVRRDVEDGLKAGVQGTPTVFLGVRDGESQNIKVLRMIVARSPMLSSRKPSNGPYSKFRTENALVPKRYKNNAGKL